MDLMSYEEFKKTPEYQKFIAENPGIGTLKVLAFTAYQAVPIPNVEIVVTKDFGNHKVVFFEGYTDENGMIQNIQLPAPTRKYDPVTQEPAGHILYDLAAISEGYETIKKYNIDMYDGISTIQYVKMIPQVEFKGVKFDGN